MAIFKETTRKRAAVPDRSEPPDLENADDRQQPPARKKPRRDPPADSVRTAAAASPIIRAKKRSRRPSNRPAGNGDAPKPSQCAGVLLALLREGVSQPTWIMQKDLSVSDVSHQQSRLLLTHTQVKKTTLRDLITSDEAALVVDREHGLPVRVFDRLGEEHAMTFKFLESNGDFRLIGGWGRFVKRNRLRAGDLLDVWAFRCCDGLGMALLSHKKDEEVPKLDDHDADHKGDEAPKDDDADDHDDHDADHKGDEAVPKDADGADDHDDADHKGDEAPKDADGADGHDDHDNDNFGPDELLAAEALLLLKDS